MPSLSEKDRANLEGALDAIRKINEFTNGIPGADEFYANELIFDATLMNFVVLGEVVEKLSPALLDNYPDVPWPQVKNFRNIIAHNYFGVDAEEVWQIIHDHLPKLKRNFLQFLENR